MISYYITLFIIISFFIIVFLINKNLIFKESKIITILRSKTINYLIKRILFALVTLFIIITVTFLLIRIMPKDYFYSTNEINPLNNNNIYNTKDNIFKQLANYYYSILPFPKKVCTSTYLEDGILVCNNYSYKIIDLGYSFSYMKNIRVWSIIKEKCSVSFIVGSLGFILQCLIGYPLGIYMAKKKNSKINKPVYILQIVIYSLPAILYFYLFVMFFMLVVKLPISFEINNYLSYLAPLISLCLWGCFTVAYWVNKYISLETNKDYVKFATAKGISDNKIFYKHIVRNALTPLIRTIPTSLVLCLSGFYLLESAFGIPGVGLTLITAINLQDVYLVQGLILFFSVTSISAYLLGDIITILLDKKVSLLKEDKNYER